MALGRIDEARNVFLGPGNLELIKQEHELLVLIGQDLVLGRQLPQLALVRAECLLARLVQELDVVIVRLAFVERVREAPRLDGGQQVLWKRRVFVERVLETRREVDLGSFDLRESGGKSSSGSVDAPCWTAPASPYERATSPSRSSVPKSSLTSATPPSGQR